MLLLDYLPVLCLVDLLQVLVEPAHWNDESPSWSQLAHKLGQ